MSEIKNIPKHWEIKRLGEILKVSSGKGLKINLLQGGNYPVYGGNGINGFHSEYFIESPKLIIGRVGAKCGVTCITKPKSWVTDNALIVDPIISDFDLKFFQLKLEYENLNKLSVSTAQPVISGSKIYEYEILLPPLSEQQLIVSKIEELLSELDNGKQQLLIAQQQLKVYRQSLLKWAFEGKLTNKNVKKGELPKGWKWVSLGGITEKQTLKVLPKDFPDSKFIGMDCIEPHTLKPAFTYQFSEFKSAGNYFKTGQVLYGRMRPYLNKVYRAEYDGTCSGEFIILQCKENFNPDLLKYILHSREFVSFANHKTSGDRPRISYDEIAEFPIALATIEEQHLIVNEIETKLTVCDKIEETISQSLLQAETLRQSILKKAFEGRLVSVNYNSANEYDNHDMEIAAEPPITYNTKS